jgi:hypothetical protein
MLETHPDGQEKKKNNGKKRRKRKSEKKIGNMNRRCVQYRIPNLIYGTIGDKPLRQPLVVTKKDAELIISGWKRWCNTGYHSDKTVDFQNKYQYIWCNFLPSLICCG